MEMEMTSGETGARSSGNSKFYQANAASSKIGIFILSSVRLHREGLVWGLSRSRGLTILGSAALADAVAAQIANLPISVLVVDAVAPKDLDLLRNLTQVHPEIKTVVVTSGEAHDEIVAYAEAGVAGYITREGSIEDLSAAILAAQNGELACSPRTTALLFQRLAALSKGKRGQADEPLLTRREREVAKLMTAGLSNKEIARSLRVRFGTVKNHVHNILKKLQVRGRLQAAQRLRSTLAD
jgi:two-component system nitrate/nitrite response regulator NarL